MCSYVHLNGRFLYLGMKVLVGPPHWSMLKYLDYYWMDCDGMFARHSQSTEDTTFHLALPAGQSLQYTKLS